jgi:uncharacterized protein (DUF779 family)
MQRPDNSSERVGTRGGRLELTNAARDTIGQLCSDHGRKVLLLSWPGGAVCLPRALYTPGDFDFIMGHIARCPVYVDVRQLRVPPGSCAVLDATEVSRHPLLRLRCRHEPRLHVDWSSP